MDYQSLTEDQFLFLRTLEYEYEKGFLALNSLGEYSVTFFGGAKVKKESQTYKDIKETAILFAKEGWSVISGGGPGVMQASVEGANEVGGKTGAFTIDIEDEMDVDYKADIVVDLSIFSVRKHLLRQADVIIVAPGGFGTLDELIEVLNLIKTEKIPKKPIFLYDKSYWERGLEWFSKTLLEEGLIPEKYKEYFILVDSPKEIHDKIFKQK